MVDLDEQLVPAKDVGRFLPGDDFDEDAVWRWRTKGVRGVLLETCLIGGRRYTSKEALGRFIARTTEKADEGTGK